METACKMRKNRTSDVFTFRTNNLTFLTRGGSSTNIQYVTGKTRVPFPTGKRNICTILWMIPGSVSTLCVWLLYFVLPKPWKTSWLKYIVQRHAAERWHVDECQTLVCMWLSQSNHPGIWDRQWTSLRFFPWIFLTVNSTNQYLWFNTNCTACSVLPFVLPFERQIQFSSQSTNPTKVTHEIVRRKGEGRTEMH